MCDKKSAHVAPILSADEANATWQYRKVLFNTAARHCEASLCGNTRWAKK